MDQSYDMERQRTVHSNQDYCLKFDSRNHYSESSVGYMLSNDPREREDERDRKRRKSQRKLRLQGDIVSPSDNDGDHYGDDNHGYNPQDIIEQDHQSLGTQDRNQGVNPLYVKSERPLCSNYLVAAEKATAATTATDTTAATAKRTERKSGERTTEGSTTTAPTARPKRHRHTTDLSPSISTSLSNDKFTLPPSNDTNTKGTTMSTLPTQPLQPPQPPPQQQQHPLSLERKFQTDLVPIVLSVAKYDFLLLQLPLEFQSHVNETTQTFIQQKVIEETYEGQRCEQKSSDKQKDRAAEFRHELGYVTNLTALFDNDNILDLSIRKFFTMVRTDEDLIEVHNFGNVDELVLEIPQLDISITEDSAYSNDILLNDFTKIYNALKYKTLNGFSYPSYLNFRITSQRRFITSFNGLNDMIRAGYGFENCSYGNKLEVLENNIMGGPSPEKDH